MQGIAATATDCPDCKFIPHGHSASEGLTRMREKTGMLDMPAT